ncbi:MAG: hypothetical protein SOU51_06345 [Collinsella sp.]|nr:hypothetical protein [Collinsella sp.]
MLEDADVRMIRRHHLLPKIALSSLASLFLAGGLFIVIDMVDSIALGGKGPDEDLLFAYIGAVVIAAIACVGCVAGARMGFASERWQHLVRTALDAPSRIEGGPMIAGGMTAAGAGRAAKALSSDDLDVLGTGLELAGAAVSIAGIFKMLGSMSRTAEAVARAHGVKLGSTRPHVLVTLLLPLLALALASAPHLVASAQASDMSRQSAAESLRIIASALESGCDQVIADDPLDHRKNGGYRASGNNVDEEGDVAARVSVMTDPAGRIEGIVYSASVDASLAPDENLAFAEDSLSAFWNLISDIDVAVAEPRLLDAPHLPQEFRDTFLAGDYHAEIDVDLERSDTIRSWALFSTDPEEEFDEYSRPEISIFLLTRPS